MRLDRTCSIDHYSVQILPKDSFLAEDLLTQKQWLSEPVANCSANATPLQNISLYDREVPRVSNAFYNGFIEAGKVIGQQCEIQTGALTDAGPHMSSAIISRDMLSIVDAFAATEDGERAAKPNHLLNYYGIIYG